MEIVQFSRWRQNVIEEPKILLERTDVLCIHALGSMLTMLIPLSRGVSFKELGLAKEEGETGYVHVSTRETLTQVAEL